MTSPWRGTTPQIASQDDSRYETPGGAQQKADKAEQDAKDYTDAKLALPELPIANGSIVERHYRTESVSERALGQKVVTRSKIGTGAVGSQELDPILFEDFGDIAVQAKFDSYGFVYTLTQTVINNGYATGTLRLPAGVFIVSNLNITSSLNIEGAGIDKTIILVGNTLNNVGFKASASRVNFRHLTIQSAGTKTDGNNITGVIFDRGFGVVGYNDLKDLKVANFSNSALHWVNPIDVSIDRIQSGGNTVGIKCTNAYGISGGTTMDIKDLYSGTDTVAINFDKVTTSVLMRPIIESCTNGIVATNSIFTVYSPYFEAVSTNDMDLTDTIMTKIGDGRVDKGNKITWINQGSSSRAGNEFSRYDVATQKLISYYVRGLSEKSITPYQYINNDDPRWVDGLIYDNHRIIPFVAPNNLLDPNNWNYPFSTSKKAIYFNRPTLSDPEYCLQTVNLSVGSYEFIAALETRGSVGISRTESFSVLDGSSNVIYTHDINPLANQAVQRFQRFQEKFTVTVDGNYTIRIRMGAVNAGVWIFGPCLYRTDRTVSPSTSFDESMRNSFIMLGHLSGIQQGYNYLGDGKKVEYGTSIPTSGTYKIGDTRINTLPTAGGYMGWVCIATGTPGTWKGYGLIEA